MSLKLVTTLAVLPLLVQGFQRGIRVDVQFNDDSVDVTLNGNHTRLVDDIALRQFAITHDRLVAGVQRLTGSRPDRVFLRDPTGNLGDQFEANGWDPTTAVLKPYSHRDAEVHYHAPVHDIQFLQNSADRSIGVRTIFDTEIEQHGNNTWSGVPRILNADPDINIRYSLRYGSWSPIDHSGRWGERSNWSRRSRHDSSVHVNLGTPPGTSLSLINGRIAARVSIIYRSTLQGKAVGYWVRGHEGRQFWAYDVNVVLWEGGMLLNVDSVEHVNAHFSIGDSVEMS